MNEDAILMAREMHCSSSDKKLFLSAHDESIRPCLDFGILEFSIGILIGILESGKLVPKRRIFFCLFAKVRKRRQVDTVFPHVSHHLILRRHRVVQTHFQKSHASDGSGWSEGTPLLGYAGTSPRRLLERKSAHFVICMRMG